MTNKRPLTVGRDSRIDLAKYTVNVRGQDIIDYEKLKANDPVLYNQVLAGEFVDDPKLRVPDDDDGFFIYADKPATIKYFYLPVFVSNPRKSQDGKYEVNMLTFANDSGQPMTYASRVLPGQTLSEAVSNDLRKDFGYEGNFEIRAHYFYDEASDRHGNPLPRIAVLIKVDGFPTDSLRPASMKAHWSADGSERLRKYRFQIA